MTDAKNARNLRNAIKQGHDLGKRDFEHWKKENQKTKRAENANEANQIKKEESKLGKVEMAINSLRAELSRQDQAERIERLEDALNQIYHFTDCTARQMEIIDELLPQNEA